MALLLDALAPLAAARCAAQLSAPALIARTRASIVVCAFIARPHAQSCESDSKLKRERQCKRSQTPTSQMAKKNAPGAHTRHASKQRHACAQTRQKSSRTHTLILRVLASLP
jgi:hypothetical protein